MRYPYVGANIVIFCDSPYIWAKYCNFEIKLIVKNPDNISAEQKELMLKLGEKIKQLRTDQKKGYIQLSEEMGIPRNTYYNIEVGKLNFQFSSLAQILIYYKNKHSILPEEFFKDL